MYRGAGRASFQMMSRSSVGNEEKLLSSPAGWDSGEKGER